MGKEKRKIDINKSTCRVCLSNNATNNIYCGKIFYNKMKVYCYQMMDDMLSLPAYLGDGLPCMICKKCLNILTAAYKLKLMAKESNRQLLLFFSGHSLKNKEEANIKKEISQTEFTVLIEKEIKKEETYDCMQLDEDYNEHDAGAKEETDASGGASSPADMKPYRNEEATRWCEVAPAKEEAPSLVAGAPSGLPAPSQGVVKSTDKPLSTVTGNGHKKVKRKYCLKAKKKPYNSRLSSSLLCEECGVTFSCKTVAEHHRRLVHLKEKRFFCNYCNKGYLDRPSLVLHIKMHEGRKTYKCPNCGKMYYSRGGLCAHLVTETGVRKYSCTLCPKKFWNRMGLVNHGITHTKERAFPCRHCPSAFSRKKNRKRHEVQMHQATPTEEELRFQKTQILVNK